MIHIKQKEGESLRCYVSQFNEATSRGIQSRSFDCYDRHEVRSPAMSLSFFLKKKLSADFFRCSLEKKYARAKKAYGAHVLLTIPSTLALAPSSTLPSTLTPREQPSVSGFIQEERTGKKGREANRLHDAKGHLPESNIFEALID